MIAVAPHPCAACPWRLGNQATPGPHGFYARSNLARLWQAMRRGERMSCHPTDPREPSHGAPDGAHMTECTGSLILKLRELDRYQETLLAAPATNARLHLPAYRRAHPHGLTLGGLADTLERCLLGGLPIRDGGARIADLDLDEPGIGYPPLGAWTPKGHP